MANFQIIPIVIEINRPTKLTGIICGKGRISEEFCVISISRNIGGGCTFTFFKCPIGNQILIGSYLITVVDLGALLFGNSSCLIRIQPKDHTGDRIFGEGCGSTITHGTCSDINEIALQFDIEHCAICRQIADRSTHNRNERCGGSEVLGLVRPYSRLGSGIKREIAVVELRIRHQVE